MSKSGGVPDAWDDDYETFADSNPSQPPTKPVPAPKASRAERKAQHAEANKQLWDSAENPETFHFMETRSQAVPLKAHFKPPLQLLSRKPQPAARANGLEQGVAGLNMQNEDDDSDEERRQAELASITERQMRAQREREEKQRRYQEVRERLFGAPTQTPESPRAAAKENGGSRSGSGGRRRGGGGGVRGSAPCSSAEQSPARGPNKTRQLYDPDLNEKPGSVFIQKRADSGAPGLKSENHPIRQPNGPGRGGFGFEGKGSKS